VAEKRVKKTGSASKRKSAPAKTLTRQEAQDVHLRLTAALITVRDRTNDFRELSTNASLLNETAPSFFALTQSLLIGDAIQLLCRITDPAYHRADAHLSVKYLSEHVPSAPPTDAIDTSMAPLRHIRNNWISHADLAKALRGDKATVTLGEMSTAATAIHSWLEEFGKIFAFPTDEPHDQGTWISAPSIVAALKDATFVHSAYVEMLRAAPTSDAARLIDEQLTAKRKDYEETPFSELEWLEIRQRVLSEGLVSVRNSLGHASFYYLAILSQVEAREHDLTVNWTDRRLAARIRSEADRLARDLRTSS
jgi:hypothetical protein